MLKTDDVLIRQTPEQADSDETHIEQAQRTIRRPFSDEERLRWEKQITRATLKIRSLKQEKRLMQSSFNERIEVQQDEAITAAEKLDEGCTLRRVPVECIWDLPSRTYREIAEDTREIAVERPMTLEEITRFQQRHLPGMDTAGSWLQPEEAVKQAAEEDEEDAEEDEDPEDLDGGGQ